LFLWRGATEPSTDTGILIDFGFKKWSQRDTSRTPDCVFGRISAIPRQNDATAKGVGRRCRSKLGRLGLSLLGQHSSPKPSRNSSECLQINAAFPSVAPAIIWLVAEPSPRFCPSEFESGVGANRSLQQAIPFKQMVLVRRDRAEQIVRDQFLAWPFDSIDCGGIRLGGCSSYVCCGKRKPVQIRRRRATVSGMPIGRRH
jgi:hypothetical protein